MKILFIAPLPPPVTGQSLASKLFLDELEKSYQVEIINISKNTFKQGLNSAKRIIEVCRSIKDIWAKKGKADIIYLSISQSITGNIKDIVTYFVCIDKLPEMIIHLHGGGIRKLIFDKYPLLHYINNFFLKRVGAAIVLGDSLTSIFEGMIPSNEMYVVPNFAEDYLFLDEDKVREKFNRLEQLNFFFLSNLIPGKGHYELVAAYKALDRNLQERIRIDFAGAFESKDKETAFLSTIKKVKRIRYHDIVSGAGKRKLFAQAHVFCLPTYYYYEGQPISILEAYASGCAVITTDHGGICDIFKDGINGYQIEKKSPISLKRVIEHIIKEPDQLLQIALLNQRIAREKYTTPIYCSSLLKLIERIGNQ
ncbi:MAG: glycosyltransferase family 4 protein [Deltaproteobacteria bacterium]|nr:glycosyltransferase family 4 protein [Deltaproteobacteria bacterium]